MSWLMLIALVGLIIQVIKVLAYRKTSYFKITHVPYAQMKNDLGRIGEYMIWKLLHSYEKRGAKFLFNAYIPKGENGTTEIDALMITAKGLFVFESKNYSGWIFGGEHQPKWHQTLPQGHGKSHRESFYNPIMQNRSHIKHLKALIGEMIPVYSIIAFSDRCTLKHIQVSSPDVYVVNRSQIVNVVPSVWKQNPNTLTESQIQALYDKLYPYTQVAEETKEKHIQDIEQKVRPVVTKAEKPTECLCDQENERAKQELETKSDAAEGTLRCPKCGNELVLRTTKKGTNAGNQFYGCSGFPKCRYRKNTSETTQKN